MAHPSTYEPSTGIERWLDARLPVPRLMHDQFMVFPTPRNLNYWWTFGGILTFMLVAQIATGIVLAMHYVPPERAFDSVEKIMRDVNWGWLLRYSHAVGASMFFVAVYIHTFRGLYYGSYKAPREVLWILGVLILLLMIATAFMGYSLVWGQMSFWAVTVITNLFSSLDAVVPGLGTRLVEWIWGGFAVGGPTLNRLYSLHYLFPFIIAGVVVLHIWALHMPGNNNPTGIDVKSRGRPCRSIPTTRSRTASRWSLFVLFFAGIVFYAPNCLGHPDNYVPANPLQTPPHIVPEWYFLPFYAILRAIPNKLFGVIALLGSIGILFFVPWLDTSKVRSTRYRPIYKWFFWAFVVTCFALGYLGSQQPEGVYLILGRIFTVYYFAFFLVVMPVVGWIEKPSGLPGSITEPVLGPQEAKPASPKRAPQRRAPERWHGCIRSSTRACRRSRHRACSLAARCFRCGRSQARRGSQASSRITRAGDRGAGLELHPPVRHLRQRPAPARLPGLQGCLRQLPFDAALVLPQSRRAGRTRILAEGGGDARLPSAGHRRAERQGRDVPASGAAVGPVPLALRQRAAGAQRQSRRAAARSLGDGQGAAGRPRLYLRVCSPAITAAAGLRAGAGHALQRCLSRASDRHAAAFERRLVPYTDGTKPTVDNYARDVSAYLMWAAEPKLEERHKLGARVMIFLIVFAVIMYLAKRAVWARLHGNAAHTA